MKQIVVSVRDSAVNSYMQPFFVPAVGAAVRSFGDEVCRKESPMCGHPDDYELFELGSFDDETGKFVNLPEPRSLTRGKDYEAKLSASGK